MEQILFSPPVAFIVILAVMFALSKLCSLCAAERREKLSGGEKGYACGEDFHEHMIQPDYSQFFPFAFFFTILHVVALMIATVPHGAINMFAIAAVYIVGAIIGLTVLLRK